MRIINKTDLTNEQIGKVIDHISKDQDTLYYGKVSSYTFSRPGKDYRLTIYYMKSDTKLVFEEVHNVTD